MKKVIFADKFFLPGGTEGPGYLTIENGLFGGFSKTKPADKIEDFSGRRIAPGLVDTHIHGLLGHDVMDNDPEGLKKMSEGLLSCGVTSFLPTTMTAGIKHLDAVVETVAKNKDAVPGARIEGIFLEGPFFNEKYKGAQPREFLAAPDTKILDNWQRLSGGLIKKTALAPELDGAADFIRRALSLNIKAALGHSNATYEQALSAVKNGADIFVHTFNAMSPFTHRNPGMSGAALNSGAFCELICDGIHLHPAAAEILFKIKGPDRAVLITDCMMAGLMPEGEVYELGGQPVTIKNGAARLKGADSLAGSVLTMINAVKNMVRWNICTPEQAIKMASLTPAISAGIDNVCGQILPGRRADFIVLSSELDLLETYLSGVKKYSGGGKLL